MSYSVYDPCGSQIPDPQCNPCDETVELGRIRSIAFIHENYYPVLSQDPENKALWDNGKAIGAIKIIPKTSGTFDGGTAVEVPGYGDTETKMIGFKFSGSYKDPNLKSNANFYNALMNSSSYHIAFRTGTVTRISENPATVIPRTPVEEDPNSQVVWNVDFKFNGADQPVPFDTPAGVFTCPVPEEEEPAPSA